LKEEQEYKKPVAQNSSFKKDLSWQLAYIHFTALRE